MADIKLENVTKRFPDGYEAVRDMNLEIKDGEFMILVGPSGCGKSTALRMIAGLEDITDGELKIGGDVVNDRAPKDRDIAMVFQNYALYPHMSVRDNMGFALKLRHVDSEEIDKKVTEAARVLDLEAHLDRKPSQLSGGQRQRVAMGRAIVRDPAAFLMDEPLSNLDAKLRVQMRTEVARLQQQLGTTTIYVTHDQTEAMTLGDRVAVMRSGVVQQVGAPMELYQRAGEPVRGRLHRLAGDELHAGDGRGRHGQAAVRRRAAAAGDARARQQRRGPPADRGHPARALRGRVAGRRRQGPRLDVPREDRRARVDGLRAVRALHRGVGRHDRVRRAARARCRTRAAARSRRAGEGRIVARLDPAAKVQQGQEAELWVDATQLQLFDPDDGRNLMVDAPAPRGDPDSAAGGEQPATSTPDEAS